MNEEEVKGHLEVILTEIRAEEVRVQKLLDRKYRIKSAMEFTEVAMPMVLERDLFEFEGLVYRAFASVRGFIGQLTSTPSSQCLMILPNGECYIVSLTRRRREDPLRVKATDVLDGTDMPMSVRDFMNKLQDGKVGFMVRPRPSSPPKLD